MSRLEKAPHIFGVRHLSPGGAFHLVKFLNEIKPTAVLVEGLSDTNAQIEYFTKKETKLPIAILAYTEELPVRTLLYPFSGYSPEYQALLWAKENGALAEFIDLPSDVFLALQSVREENPEKHLMPRGWIYSEWARIAGEEDHDTYWERDFEHNLNPDTYRKTSFEFGKSLREISADTPLEYAENLVREAFMRYRIQDVIKRGHQPDKIVVVTGAYHASVLGPEFEPMTEEEVRCLPRLKSSLTLMPYSYFRLSSQSGYGAGNHAPNYFEMMWECLQKGQFDDLPMIYLSKMAEILREKGTWRSSAEVIEGVRLSRTLAAMHGGSAPTLRDLRDAAMILLGYGDLAVIAEAAAKIEIGTAIGELPEGVSRTSIQDDFYRELKKLKLEKYKSNVAMDLELDLRENRRVKTEEAAFLDLNRSNFLHRLKVLGVSFASQQKGSQQAATWAERWVLRWTPEAEIQLVESTLRGETIELAGAFEFKQRLSQCERVHEAAAVIREACECGMEASMEEARKTLQRLAVDSGAFVEIAAAASELAMVISYGDIRKFEASHLIPLMQQLFLRGTLLLLDAAKCDNQAAKEVVHAVHKMNQVALEHYKEVDEALWIETLGELSDRDDRNPTLSGYACAILLERNIMSSEKLSQEVSRRLSPGIAADLGAGWFEGLSMRNRYALLARLSLWEQLSSYVHSLEDEEFKRALVFLRRAFGSFGPQEKRTIAENLGEIWGMNKDDASDLMSRELSDEEEQEIENLNEFDFGDI
ncbi:MAG: DUF5682 family protein [Clostridia bacterium]|nr:DUF5682 family protein [Clostridia bacterium]